MKNSEKIKEFLNGLDGQPTFLIIYGDMSDGDNLVYACGESKATLMAVLTMAFELQDEPRIMIKEIIEIIEATKAAEDIINGKDE